MPTLPRMEVRLAHTAESTAQGSHPQPEEARSRGFRWSIPRLLIIRDSYADSLVPFLTPHFSEIHLLDLRYYKLSLADYIAQNGIDQALVLYSVPNFVTDSNLLWIAK